MIDVQHKGNVKFSLNDQGKVNEIDDWWKNSCKLIDGVHLQSEIPSNLSDKYLYFTQMTLYLPVL